MAQKAQVKEREASKERAGAETRAGAKDSAAEQSRRLSPLEKVSKNSSMQQSQHPGGVGTRVLASPMAAPPLPPPPPPPPARPPAAVAPRAARRSPALRSACGGLVCLPRLGPLEGMGEWHQ